MVILRNILQNLFEGWILNWFYFQCMVDIASGHNGVFITIHATEVIPLESGNATTLLLNTEGTLVLPMRVFSQIGIIKLNPHVSRSFIGFRVNGNFCVALK